MGDIEIIRGLLAELRYVHRTGDIRDSKANSEEVQRSALKRLGFNNTEAFDNWCDAEG